MELQGKPIQDGYIMLFLSSNIHYWLALPLKTFRRMFRLGRLAYHILVGSIITVILFHTEKGIPPQTRQQEKITWWFRHVTKILGLRITLHGKLPTTTVLAVANHISWLDIIILGSILPVSFVSKAEVRRWPIIGWLAMKTGTLFIQRGSRNAANQVTEQITWYLRRNRGVLIFPEGTTTDGRQVHRFHPRLFGAAIHAHGTVQPVAIRFPHKSGVNPAAPFIGNDTILKSSLRIMGEPHIDVALYFAKSIPGEHADRNTLAKESHASIERYMLQHLPESHVAHRD